MKELLTQLLEALVALSVAMTALIAIQEPAVEQTPTLLGGVGSLTLGNITPIPTAQEQVLLTKIEIAQALFIAEHGEYFQVNKGKKNPDDAKEDFANFISKSKLTEDTAVLPYCRGCDKPEGHGYRVIIGNKSFGYGHDAVKRTYEIIIPTEDAPVATTTP